MFEPEVMPAASMINAGAVAIESDRAVAEARGQMQLAKMFPRDLNKANIEIMTACGRMSMASVAFYSVPQGGSRAEGVSIRLAEELARAYGNFEFGHREFSRTESGPGPKDFGRSEIEVYAWDKETNVRSIRQITVVHCMDTKDGPKKLRDQRDVDNRIANIASKQVRGRILALMPKWLVEEAKAKCKETLRVGIGSRSLPDQIRDMAFSFAQIGVTTAMLENYFGHSLDSVNPAELSVMPGVYNAITSEGIPVTEFFTMPAIQQPGQAASLEAAATHDTPKRMDPPTEKPKRKAAPVKESAQPAQAPVQTQAPVQQAVLTPAPVPQPAQQRAPADDVPDRFAEMDDF